MSQIVEGAYKELPRWAKGVIAVGVVAGVGFGVYAGVKMVKNLFSDSTLDKLKYAGKLSYPRTSYTQMADAIYDAGINTWFGTNEEAIYSVIRKMNNERDVLELISAFGDRRAEFTIGSVGLGGFLRSELDVSEMLEVNKILAEKNINYTF